MQKVSQHIRIAYLKLCLAGLQEDMAQRIMFSTLPFLASPAQVALTKGVVDINALKAAVEGRKDIIKYGVMAVLGELEHYNESFAMANRPQGKKSAPYQHCKNSILSGQYHGLGGAAAAHFAKAMDIAIEAFQDSKAWYTSYGGRPWEMIARTIRQIARLDRTLDELRASPRSIERDEQEVQIMRDLIVEMNVFDGLAHNSDSILNNIAEQEAHDKVPASNPHERKQRYTENYVKLKRLMDAKELDSPVEVFKQIQDTLTGSGDIHKFKDWVTKMRSKPEYRQTDSKLGKSLLTIYLRKALAPARSAINIGRDNLSSFITELTNHWDNRKFELAVESVGDICDYLIILTGEFAEHLQAFETQYPELDCDAGFPNHLLAPFEQMQLSANLLEANIAGRAEFLRGQNAAFEKGFGKHEPYKPDPSAQARIKQQQSLFALNEIITFLNRLSFMLDSI